jgi:hypothetical protein
VDSSILASSCSLVPSRGRRQETAGLVEVEAYDWGPPVYFNAHTRTPFLGLCDGGNGADAGALLAAPFYAQYRMALLM